MKCTYCEDHVDVWFIIDLETGVEIACEGCNEFLYVDYNFEKKEKTKWLAKEDSYGTLWLYLASPFGIIL